MRFVIQRVKSSRLEVDGELVSEIGRGYNVFLGVTKGDTMDTVQKCARRIATVRLFKDDTTDKLQYNISQVGGEILLVSNFLYYNFCIRKDNLYISKYSFCNPRIILIQMYNVDILLHLY